MAETSPKIKVLGIIFQNSFGERYYSKYFLTHCKATLEYDLRNEKDQRNLQAKLRDKVDRMKVVNSMTPATTEIFSLSNITILFKVLNELQIYLLCEDNQNYFLMENVIDCMGRVLQLANTLPYTGKAIYDHLDVIVTATDQIIDEGIIVTLDPAVVFYRLKMRDSTDPLKKVELKPVTPPAAGGTFASIFSFAKSSLQKTLNLG